jgi:hypothetical protein
MSLKTDLGGRWVGSYDQHGRAHPIEAAFVQTGESLAGSMRDGETDSDRSLFDLAAEAGLPPGEDERIVEHLRREFPDAPATPIRYVTHLPPDSSLEGWVRGTEVYFLKTYRGTHSGGFQVGVKLVGFQKSGHAVHYRGQVSSDGAAIEGRWWIGPASGPLARGAEGSFSLRRQPRAATSGEPTGPVSTKGPRPWWRFWSSRGR